MANFDTRIAAIRQSANANAKTLVEYLRKTGLIAESPLNTVRDYTDEREEVLHNAALAAYDLARRIATL